MMFDWIANEEKMQTHVAGKMEAIANTIGAEILSASVLRKRLFDKPRNEAGWNEKTPDAHLQDPQKIAPAYRKTTK